VNIEKLRELDIGLYSSRCFIISSTGMMRIEEIQNVHRREQGIDTPLY